MSKQLSFTDAERNLKKRRTRRAAFLERMNNLVPWQQLVDVVEPVYPKGKSGPKGGSRKPYPLETMLRIHCLQQWYNLSDPAMEDALYDSEGFQAFIGMGSLGRVPDETTICKFRHLLERHELGRALFETINAHLAEQGVKLSGGTVMDATIISAPSSTKNERGERDPEMKQTQKGNEWHFGMKAHIGADLFTGIVHSFGTTAANVHDLNAAEGLLHGDEEVVLADAGYRGVENRAFAQAVDVEWVIACRPGEVRQWRQAPEENRISLCYQRVVSSLRAKVEHPFHAVKCLFGYRKTRYRGIEKNDNKLAVLFGLANLLRAEKCLQAA